MFVNNRVFGSLIVLKLNGNYFVLFLLENSKVLMFQVGLKIVSSCLGIGNLDWCLFEYTVKFGVKT